MRELFRTTRPDFLVLNHSLKYLPTLVQGRILAPSRTAVALWGHAVSYNSNHHAWVSYAKLKSARIASWYFSYTQAGASTMSASGFPAERITVVNNTLDTDALSRELAAVTPFKIDAFRSSQSLTEGHTALFLGGVDDAKGFDFLIDVTRNAARIDPAFRMIIAGTGSRIDKARELARQDFGLIVLGRVDGASKAAALRSSEVLCIPSGIGLVAVDALFAGLGIVSRDDRTHGPEIDYLPKISLTAMPPDVSAAEFSRRLVARMLDGELAGEVAIASRAPAANFTIEGMVERFVEGVIAWGLSLQ